MKDLLLSSNFYKHIVEKDVLTISQVSNLLAFLKAKVKKDSPSSAYIETAINVLQRFIAENSDSDQDVKRSVKLILEQLINN